MVNNSIKAANSLTIRGIKKKMQQVNVTELADRLGYSRANIYKHLDEKEPEKANVDQLKKIMDEIECMITEEHEKALELSKKAC